MNHVVLVQAMFLVVAVLCALLSPVLGDPFAASLNFQQLQHEGVQQESEDLFWPPAFAESGNFKKEYAVIFLGGAQISPMHYQHLLLAIKSQTAHSMWIAAPSLPFNFAFPTESIFQRIDSVVDRLYSNGLPPSAPIFIGGHSLGAATVQAYIKSRQSARRFAGSFFLGSSLLRRYANESLGGYPAPWIQISGELDGLHRPMRAAQSFYHYVRKQNASASTTSSRPGAVAVIVIKGMNHMQVVDDNFSGNSITNRADLQATANSLETRVRVAQLLVNFMELQAGLSANPAQSLALQSAAVQETAEFVRPLIEAMEMEANYYLKKRCNSDHPAPHCPFYPAWPPQPVERQPSTDTDCWCGLPWAAKAVQRMADLPAKQFSVYSVDALHDVSDTHPFHHAHIWNNCSSSYAAKQPCTLNVTTVSQVIFDRLIDWDTGLSMSSARELRVKMKSRQLYRRNADQPDAPYSLDLDNSICQSINEQALKWALEKSSLLAHSRYLRHGQRMEFLPDYHFPIGIGPLWINTPLRLREVGEGKERVLQVQSISMRTTLDSWVNRLHPDSGGQHYCKLLSPARAMEWIYTDSLRMNLGIKA